MTGIEEKVYTPEEVKPFALEYFKGDELSADQWIRKYSLKDSKGNIYEKSPEDMHKRMASEISRIEEKYGGERKMSYDEVFSLIDHFKYIIPGGSNMSGIKNDKQVVSLSNCFVIGDEKPSDSYGGIMYIDQQQVQLMKRRGGVGHDLSHIRPKGSPVKNSALTSTGVVPFMVRYSNSTKEVAQDGRRGALMLSISIKHPDAEDFIDAKLEEGKITGANISVKIDDKFMEAVKEDRDYVQQFPIDSENPTFKKKIKAKTLWDKIVHNAWKSAEPGILFWDKIKNEAIPDNYGKDWKTVSTNPCGEIPLCPYDSCRLEALNLYSYVKNPFTDKAEFNHDLFKDHAHKSLRVMDDILDLEEEKINKILEKIESDPEPDYIKDPEKRLWTNILEKAKKGRRTGIGITAEGDMLAALGLRYGTEEATAFSEELHKYLAVEVYRESVNLAKERGAFPMYDSEKEKNNPFINRIKEADKELYGEMVKNGRRNISMLTIAPTGTVSLMTQTTSGIEPLFTPFYQRNVKVEANDKNTTITFSKDDIDWHTYNVFHPKFKEWLKINGYDIKKVENIGKEEMEELVKKSPYYKATSEDVDWIKKVEMQGRIQRWVDHSISATTNMPKGTPKEIVGKAYMKAWESGCKGMTVYVDGSRGEGVLNKGKKENALEKIVVVENNVKLDKRLEIKPYTKKYRVQREQDSLHAILTSDLYVDDKNKKAYFVPSEDFQLRSPLGAESSVNFSSLGWAITKILKGVDPDYAELVSNFESIYSNELEGIGPTQIKSIQHAVGLIFEDYFLRTGIVGKKHGMLVNLVRKPSLRKVDPKSKEYEELLSNVKSNTSGEEITITGNNGELGFKFVCEQCGSTDFTTKEGCPNPICKNCGWSDLSKACE